MFVILFCFWVILNGKLNLETALIGIVLSGAIYAFMCLFFNFRWSKDIRFVRNLGLLARYIGVLIVEIFKSNLKMLAIVLNKNIKVTQAMVTFDVDLKSDLTRAILADSITLTPGTITVLVEGNRFTVHCLSRDMLDGIQNGSFIKLLRKMEG